MSIEILYRALIIGLLFESNAACSRDKVRAAAIACVVISAEHYMQR